MLPRTMRLKRQTEDQLKKLKAYTGIAPNVSSRIAFFRSFESGYRYSGEAMKLDGSMDLAKVVWLGELELAVVSLLRMHYPTLSPDDLEYAWAAHVEDGISSVRNLKSLNSFVGKI